MSNSDLRLHVKYLPIDVLQPCPNNPRTHSKKQIEQIERSIKTFGFNNPVLWPAPGSEDTELGVLMGPEVRHGEAEVYARVQA